MEQALGYRKDEGPPGCLGDLVRARRERAGLTQRELAVRAGMSLGAVRDIEQGRTAAPRAGSLARLAPVLELSGPELERLASEPGSGRAAARGGPREGAGAGLVVAVLGPVAAWRDGVPLSLGPVRQRAVLALLALARPGGLSRAALVEGLWGEDPPAAAVGMLQGYVAGLRRLAEPGRGTPAGPAGPQGVPGRGGGVLAWDGAGYRLAAAGVRCDLADFGELAGRARRAVAAGDAVRACGLFEQALGLWRGDPAADVELLRGHPAVTGLRRRRVAVVLEYADAAAAAGVGGQAAEQLQARAAGEPLDERVHARLMTALAAAGQQAAALEVYADVRGRLDRELGVRPGRELAEAHVRVLRQEIPAAPARVGAGPAPRPEVPAAPATTGPAPRPDRVVPRQLPALGAHFAGRAAELAMLDSLLDPGPGAPGAVVISAIGGTAGVGKTALAVRWAHRVAGRFPDGQLYVNLRGFDPSGEPVGPADALRDFLTALEVPAERLPAEVDARAGLYRSLLAGRRMLIVADNAADEEQVRPLLPGSSGCLVIVTSRCQLTGLVTAGGACPLTLDVLSDSEARELLVTRLGALRVAAEPEAAAELAVLCAWLPLSLSVTAARAAIRPGLRLAVLAAELREARDRLDVLSTGDPATSVRAVLSWSYAKLDGPAARMFRLLGLHPGPDISVPAAASLAGTGPGPAAELLGRLARAHLLTEHAPGRYAAHDLLRGYAAGQARATDTEEDQRAALARLLDYYVVGAEAAGEFLSPGPPAGIPVWPVPGHEALALATPAEARAWLDAELTTLVAVAAQVGSGWPDHVIHLSESLSSYLDASGRCPEALVIHTAALEAAERSGDRRAQASALVRLAGVDFWLDRLEPAADRLRAALARYDQLGDRIGQSRLLNNLGLVAWRLDRYPQAAGYYRQALEIAVAIDYPVGEANSLNNLGILSSRRGDYQLGAEYCSRALDIARKTGSRLVGANILDNLGQVMLGLGRYQEAAEYYRQVIGLAREIGSRRAEADSLDGLGRVLRHQGRYEQAADHHERALVICREAGRRRGEAVALNSLGETLRAAGRPGQALARHEEALAVALQVNDRYQQARAHAGLAGIYADADDPEAATGHWQRAYAGFADLGVPEADDVRARLEEPARTGGRNAAVPVRPARPGPPDGG